MSKAGPAWTITITDKKSGTGQGFVAFGRKPPIVDIIRMIYSLTVRDSSSYIVKFVALGLISWKVLKAFGIGILFRR